MSPRPTKRKNRPCREKVKRTYLSDVGGTSGHRYRLTKRLCQGILIFFFGFHPPVRRFKQTDRLPSFV
jgi:hypothetical protein